MMNRLLIVFLILIGFAGCTNLPGTRDKAYMSIRGLTQGTTYMVKYNSPDSTNYRPYIERILGEIDSSMSTYQDHSIISRINRNEPSVETDEHFRNVYRTAERVSRMTDGAFDITVAPLVNAWGFGFTEKKELNSTRVDSLLEFVGYETMRLEDGRIYKTDKRTMIDMNAVAKGYTVDEVSEFLENEGVSDYMVEIGGEVRTRGKNPDGVYWRIGIDKPIDSSNATTRELQAIINLKNQSIATSGSYRQFYVKDGVKYSHTINPKTGYPVEHNLLSVSVFAEECGFADALATAFMVMGREKSKRLLENHSSVGAYFIYSDEEGDFQVEWTENVKDLIKNL
ncbi:MAG: FAD:protein FMN transferase [Bacteroidales bacterium]|nr:FAD:protein FMN transferase [Bacteroidales bacterium]